MGNLSSVSTTFDANDDEIVKSGNLEKESKYKKKWRKRYTILTKSKSMHCKSIYTFKSNDTSTAPTECIDVNDYNITNKGEYFWLSNQNKVFNFKCADSNEANQWMNAIAMENDTNKEALAKDLMEKKEKANELISLERTPVENRVLNENCFDNELFGNIDINKVILKRKCKESEKCLSIQRMKTLLCTFSEASNEIIETLENIVMEYYNVTAILNDYIHITNQHNDILEDVYKLLQLKCDISACNSICRNQSDRNKATRSNTNYTMIDLLDQIHCYFCHAFDSGYRLLKEELSLISEEKNNINHHTDTHYLFHHMKKILYNKRERFRKCVENNRIKEHKKFVTVIEKQELFLDLFYSSLKECNCEQNAVRYDSDAIKDDLFENTSNCEIDFKQSNIFKYLTDNNESDELVEAMIDTLVNQNKHNENITIYCFSHRFYYWQYYKNRHCDDNQNAGYKCSELYISNKHISLKEELLQNDVCKIGQVEWHIMNEKAQHFIQTAHVKQYKSSSSYEKGSGLKDKSAILLTHLVAVIAYCDFDDLSYNFSCTFRYSEKINTLIKLKEYHSNYYWFARYLRELVELFGKTLAMRVSKFKLYHGISKLMTFNATVARFCHPTSTTKRIEVAQLFATNQGIILQLHAANFSLPYFSCSFISRFPLEEECLFIAGYNRLKLLDIIDCQTDIHYSQYLKIMNVFIIQMQAGVYEKLQFDDSLLQDLIENNSKTIPKYICNIFDKWKIDTKQIILDIKSIAQYGGKYLPLLLLTSPNDIFNSFINLNVICEMFKNCKKIIIRSDFGLNLRINKTYLLLILSQLQKINHISHRLVVILFEGGIDVDFKALQSLKMKYKNVSFNINTTDDGFRTIVQIGKISSHKSDKTHNEADVDMKLFETVNEKDNSYCRNLFQCQHIQRMKRILSLKPANVFIIYEKEIHKYYDITCILNDYCHIVTVHKNDLEEIVDILKLHACNLLRCDAIKKEYRNRVTDLIADTFEESVLSDIFNQIHNYFMHTFDCGFRLLKAEKLQTQIDCACGNKMEFIQSGLAYGGSRYVCCDGCKKQTKYISMIYHCRKNYSHPNGADLCMDCADIKFNDAANEVNNKLSQTKKVLNDKINLFNKLTKYNEMMKHSKFVTDINESEQGKFGNSHRLLYWDKNKNDKKEDGLYDELYPQYAISDAYVKNKYVDLKTELLQNDISCIDYKLWQYVTNRCSKYLQTSWMKERKPCYAYVGYLKNVSKKILSNHLICIALYCDYNELSYNLCLSLKYSSKIKNLTTLKSYHSNYYWFAKNLVELVHVFGEYDCVSYSKQWIGYFYYGLSEAMVLESTQIPFTHPISATKSIEIINYYINNFENSGIILKFQPQSVYFDCSFISSYTNENQHLFMGSFPQSHYYCLNIKDIIVYKNCVKYTKYLNALNLFVALTITNVKGIQLRRPDIVTSDAIDGVLKSLISTQNNKEYDNNIPQYVMGMFNKYLLQTKVLTINFRYMEKSKYLFSLLLTSPNNIKTSFVNLDITCQLFPNIEKIVICNDMNNRVTADFTYLSFISSSLKKLNSWMNEAKPLRKIEIKKICDIKTALHSFPQCEHCKMDLINKFQFHIERI